MKRILVVVALLSLLSVPVWSNGKVEEDEKTSAETRDTAVTLKIGHVWNEQHSAHKGFEKFAELCEANSGGTIKVEIFPNSVLGSERELLEGARFGSIDIACTGTAGWAVLAPDLAVFELPYMYRDLEHQKKTFDDPWIWEIVDKMFNDAGLKALAYYSFGIRSVICTKKIEDLEDFKGVNLRVPAVPTFVKTFQALGANPVTIAYSELYSAIQTGVADGLESSPESIYNNKLHEITKYFIETNHQSPPMIMAMNAAKFNSLSEDQKEAVLEAAGGSSLYQYDLTNKANEDALEAFKTSGLQIIHLDPKELQRMKDAVQPVIVELAGSVKSLDGMDLYKQIQDIH